jgi:hypothetical protein
VVSSDWRGCLISLTGKDKVDKFVEFSMNDYYLNKENRLLVSDDLAIYIFKSFFAKSAVILDP